MSRFDGNIMAELFSDIGIFTGESYILNKVFIACLLLLFAVISAAEYHVQTSEIPVSGIVKGNLLYFGSAWLLLLLLEFICFWRSRWLGGEIPAVVISFLAAVILLFILKKHIFDSMGFGFAHQNLMICLPMLIIMIPIALFMGFVFLLGSSWSI